MGVSADPLVSVIVPTYNRARVLPQAVQSVYRQTYQRWELLVVDDGSTDDTLRVLRDLDHGRLRVIALTHGGLAARARNAGLAAAHGAYVAFLDSDDMWQPDKLRCQLDALSQAAECRWSYTLFDHMDEGGRFLAPLLGGPWIPHSGWILDRLVTGDAVAMVQTVVAERALVEAVGGFDETPQFREDLDLCLRLAMRSPACAVGRPLTRIRHHRERTTFDLPEVRLWKERALAKLARQTADPYIRRLCRRQCAIELSDLGAWYQGSGRWWLGLRTLGAAFAYRPWHPNLWAALLKGLVRPVVPRQVLRAYRRVRGRRMPAPARGRPA